MTELNQLKYDQAIELSRLAYERNILSKRQLLDEASQPKGGQLEEDPPELPFQHCVLDFSAGSGKCNCVTYHTKFDELKLNYQILKVPLTEAGLRTNTVEAYLSENVLYKLSEYRDGKLHGRVRIYYPGTSSKPKCCLEEWYVNDKKDGGSVQWYENGELWTSSNFVNGELDGPTKYWYEDGSLMQTAEYRCGKLCGVVTGFNVDGSLKFRRCYKAGILNGYSDVFDINGDLLSQLFYKNGVVASTPTSN